MQYFVLSELRTVAAPDAKVAGIDARERERGGLQGVLESRRRQIARVVIGRIGVGDVLGEHALAFLMPLHPGAQHRENRNIGNRHQRALVRRVEHWADCAGTMVNGRLSPTLACFCH